MMTEFNKIIRSITFLSIIMLEACIADKKSNVHELPYLASDSGLIVKEIRVKNIIDIYRTVSFTPYTIDADIQKDKKRLELFKDSVFRRSRIAVQLSIKDTIKSQLKMTVVEIELFEFDGVRRQFKKLKLLDCYEDFITRGNTINDSSISNKLPYQLIIDRRIYPNEIIFTANFLPDNRGVNRYKLNTKILFDIDGKTTIINTSEMLNKYLERQLWGRTRFH